MMQQLLHTTTKLRVDICIKKIILSDRVQILWPVYIRGQSILDELYDPKM